MKETDISQKVQTSLANLLKDRYDILIDVLAKNYPNTLSKIVEQSVALQSKTGSSIFQQIQKDFEKGGLFGLIGNVTKKLFKKPDITERTETGLTDYLKDEDSTEVKYTDGAINLKGDDSSSKPVIEQVQNTREQANDNQSKKYFEEAITPIPFKFDGFTDDGETALWNVFPPLFKDIFKDILGTPVEEEQKKTEGPMSSFEEKGLFGTLLDFLTGGVETSTAAKAVKGIGSLVKGGAKAIGGGISKLAGGLLGIGKLPAGAAIAGKAGAAGLAGAGAAVVGGEIIGGQIGKAIGSNESVSEFLYGDKDAGKEAYEQYGTGITGFLRASWDYGKQLIETKKSEKGVEELQKKGVERLKNLDEPTKRKLSVKFEKNIEEQIQRIEKIKSNTEFTEEEKATQIRSIEESLVFLKENLQAVQTPSPGQKPPTASTDPAMSPSKDVTVVEPTQQQTFNEENINNITNVEQQKSIDIPTTKNNALEAKTDTKKTKTSEAPNTKTESQKQKDTNTSTLKTDSEKTKKIEVPEIKTDSKEQKNTSVVVTTAPSLTPIPKSLQDFKNNIGETSSWTPEAHKEAENVFNRLQGVKADINVWNRETIRLKEKVIDTPVQTTLKPNLKVNNITESTVPTTPSSIESVQPSNEPTNISLTPEPLPLSAPLNLQPSSQVTSSLTPTLEKESNITPVEVQMPENLQNLNIPDNADILNNIASNTNTTNDTLKNLNGAILKLAQVFNDKMDKSGNNNYIINGQQQQQSQTYPSASQVAASNYNPISRVRLQFGLA